MLVTLKESTLFKRGRKCSQVRAAGTQCKNMCSMSLEVLPNEQSSLAVDMLHWNLR